MSFDLKGEYFKVPNDIHLIVKDVYEYAVLAYLLRFANGNNQHPITSLTKLRMGLMSRQKVITTIQSLENKGYVSHIIRPYKSNEYTIHMDKILYDIRQKLSLNEIVKRAEREYDITQKLAISKRTLVNHGTQKDIDDLVKVFNK